MQDMDGRQVAASLAKVTPDLRVLFMSGYTANVIAQHGVSDEGRDFLEKPFTGHALLYRVRDLLDRPKPTGVFDKDDSPEAPGRER